MNKLSISLHVSADGLQLIFKENNKVKKNRELIWRGPLGKGVAIIQLRPIAYVSEMVGNLHACSLREYVVMTYLCSDNTADAAYDDDNNNALCEVPYSSRTVIFRVRSHNVKLSDKSSTSPVARLSYALRK